MPSSAEELRHEASVSHGICGSCSDNMAFQLGVDLETYVERLGVPIQLVDEDARAIQANPDAFQCFGVSESAVVGKYAGEVFECERARKDEGCGRDVHCSGCTIRRVVASTATTGRNHVRVPATLRFESGNVAREHWVAVSTVKSGGSVLLRIEKMN